MRLIFFFLFLQSQRTPYFVERSEEKIHVICLQWRMVTWPTKNLLLNSEIACTRRLINVIRISTMVAQKYKWGVYIEIE